MSDLDDLDIPEDLKLECPICKGTGEVMRSSFQTNADGTHSTRSMRCNSCHAKGWLLRHAEDLISIIIQQRKDLEACQKNLEGYRGF